jgi:hypothetical protein
MKRISFVWRGAAIYFIRIFATALRLKLSKTGICRESLLEAYFST